MPGGAFMEASSICSLRLAIVKGKDYLYGSFYLVQLHLCYIMCTTRVYNK